MGINLRTGKPADTFRPFDRKAASRHLIKHRDIFVWFLSDVREFVKSSSWMHEVVLRRLKAPKTRVAFLPTCDHKHVQRGAGSEMKNTPLQLGDGPAATAS